MREKTEEAPQGTISCQAERLVRRLALALQASVTRTPDGGFAISCWESEWTYTGTNSQDPTTWAIAAESLRRRANNVVGPEAAAAAGLARAAQFKAIAAAAARRDAAADKRRAEAVDEAAEERENYCKYELHARIEEALRIGGALPPDRRRVLAALCEVAPGETAEGDAAARPRLRPADAATLALDAIAETCGCPRWEYPGQVVRDVRRMAEESAKHRAEAERAGRELAAAFAERDRHASAAAEAAEARDAAEAVADAVRAEAGCGCAAPGGEAHGAECAPRALARLVGALREARREAAGSGAACLGREQRPTEAEAVAHAAAGGGWLLFTPHEDGLDGGGGRSAFFPPGASFGVLTDFEDAPEGSVFVPVSGAWRVCAWPAADPAHGERIGEAGAACARLAAVWWEVGEGSVLTEHAVCDDDAFLAKVTGADENNVRSAIGADPERAYAALAADLRHNLRQRADSTRRDAVGARDAAEKALRTAEEASRRAEEASRRAEEASRRAAEAELLADTGGGRP